MTSSAGPDAPPGKIRRGSAWGPVALLVFKTSVPAPEGAAGRFDSDTLPPFFMPGARP